MTKRTIKVNEFSPLTIEETINANKLALYLIQKHGYWMALYNIMTLVIWSRKKHLPDWDDDELINIQYCWAVRDFIYNMRRG